MSVPDRFAAVLRASPSAIVTTDVEGVVAELNAAAERLFDLPAAQVVGRTIDSVVRAPGILELVRSGSSAVRLEAGRLHVSVEPVRHGDGSHAGAVVVAHAAAGGEATSRVTAVIDQSTDAIVVADARGRVLEWNRAATWMFGGSAEAIRGRVIMDLPDERGTTDDRTNLKRALTGAVVRYETSRRSANGDRIDISVVISPLRGENGAITGVVAVCRDITAQRAAERDRDRGAARSRFLAEASQQLAGSLELDETLEKVGALLVPEWSDVSIIALDDGKGGLEAITVEYADAELREGVKRLFERYGAHPRPGGMIERALRTGRTVMAPEYRDPPDTPAGRGLYPMGARSLLVAPLRIRGTVLGVLVALMTDHSDRRFDAEDADVVQDVADRAAQAIDNARSYLEARAAEERFRAAFEDAPIGVALLRVDADGGTRYAEVNPALCQIFGSDRDVMVGRNADELTTGEQRLVRADGQERWVQVQSARLTAAPGAPVAYVAQVQDVTERRRFERELAHLASHDALTGVLNRRRFHEELERTLANVRRHGEPAALVTLDLDDFKHVNDTYGHAAGDELLRVAAHTLRDRVRATDAVGRLGGDEFGVVLAHTGPAEAQVVAEGLLEAFRDRIRVTVGRRTVRVTASAGLRPLSPEGTLSAGDLLGEADMALYEAKERGRDRLAVAGTGVQRVRHHGRVRERIRDALESDGFMLYEQPILRLADGEIDRAELLIRMIGEGGEAIPPAAFLPVAERYDHIRDIDRWVVRHAMELLARRRDAGFTVGASINLSGDSIGDASVVDFILAEIANAGVDPAVLTFEVTETTAIGNLDRARVLAQQLSELGCDFALDDFGAGFGSFSYLKHLPLDIIKIDGEFIRTLPRSTQDQVTVRAIVDIAKGLGKETVAEFVEDEATLELLKTLGVDRAQGFHIGRPRLARLTPEF